MIGLLSISVELFVFVYKPTTLCVLDLSKNSVAPIPLNWSDISSKIIFLSTVFEESNALENTLPAKEDLDINSGSVDAIAGP